MYSEYKYMYKSTIEIFVIVSYTYTSMSTIEIMLLNQTLIQVCILNIITCI